MCGQWKLKVKAQRLETSPLTLLLQLLKAHDKYFMAQGEKWEQTAGFLVHRHSQYHCLILFENCQANLNEKEKIVNEDTP